MIFHILNGDALKEQFPSQLNGTLLVARECLVDGPVSGNSLEELYQTRMKFLQEAYGESEGRYQTGVISQFEQMQQIPDGSKVNLWFEDDLFCQVNLWFVIRLLAKKRIQTFLVRPTGSSLQYGFGGLSQEELVAAYEAKQALPSRDRQHFVLLWSCYQWDDRNKLEILANQMAPTYPFLPPAIQAHLARSPQPGRPAATIQAIMAEKQTQDFGTVFQEFCRRESIYGFGDLQVKRIYDQLTS